MPIGLFSKIREIIPFSEEEWAASFRLSTKTLQWHQNNPNYHLKPIHREKIIELEEVTNFGEDVFDPAKQLPLWLNTLSRALGNIKPAELLKDCYGKDWVMGALYRIGHGIFS